MSDLWITLPNGTKVTFPQAMKLVDLIREHGEHTHWHRNDCGCCLSLHTNAGGYVIGQDGGATFFPGVTCGCGEDVHGQTR
jgi:hypothetical protein